MAVVQVAALRVVARLAPEQALAERAVAPEAACAAVLAAVQVAWSAAAVLEPSAAERAVEWIAAVLEPSVVAPRASVAVQPVWVVAATMSGAPAATVRMQAARLTETVRLTETARRIAVIAWTATVRVIATARRIVAIAWTATARVIVTTRAPAETRWIAATSRTVATAWTATGASAETEPVAVIVAAAGIAVRCAAPMGDSALPSARNFARACFAVV
ncbi:hypothetical protein [Methylobacterium sp. E-045]|uniref:hypothetical protein n=1 Tax=Methylobacterium sp. E-045 TaxID=2836575 RepID=UPI0028BD739D|nr:hypothetical protein [Methylobacterium sp. E-045]